MNKTIKLRNFFASALILFGFGAVQSVFAQTAHHNLQVVFTVVMDDATANVNDSLVFDMSKNDINSSISNESDLHTFRISASKSTFDLPISTAINYGRIKCYDKEQSLNALDNGNNLFIFQSGDTIEMHLSNKRNSAFFTGKNSEKYNCTYKLNNEDYLVSHNTFNTYAKLNRWEDAFNSLISTRDSIFNARIGLLKLSEGKIDQEIYELIKIDCWARCNEKVVGFCFAPYTISAIKEYPAAKKLFIKYYSSYNEKLASRQDLFVKSYKYGDFLYDKENTFVIINKSTATESYFPKFKFQDINDAIDLHYNEGPLKDKMKLLAFSSFDWKRQGDFVYYIDKAINEAGNNSFKTSLMQFKSAMATGADIFPFEMIDKNGTKYTSKDFKGKLIVIDFWFTGCKACTQMASSLKSILPVYRANPYIAFVSVSIDRDKKLWLNSLKEEKYSSPDEINLMEGMDGQSSFMRYYNINEYPTLIVVSKSGKVLSVTPPDPRSNPSEFNKFLNQNL
jgi:cytochrome oxidase Cu insertion factor (SCO1/SenC/PrrC family)